MPPQNGKSKLISEWYPVFHLDWRPSHRIILTSYAAEYAAEWGRAVRNNIEAHADELRVRIADDSSAADAWNTTEGGGMVSVGIGGGVTGRRANILIIDDPFKNAEEANSERHREKVWLWYLSAAYTRLTPDGAIVLVQTRWHEDDLAGRLIAESKKAGAEKWEVLNLPAIAEQGDILGRAPGEPLWPSRWPLAALDRIRRTVGTFVWNALFQQRPTAPEGNYFKRAWFTGKIVPASKAPSTFDRVVRFWDMASTEAGESGNADPDFTAGCKIGLSGTSYYVLDLKKFRESPATVESTVKTTARGDGYEASVRIEQEPGSSGKTVIDNYRRKVLGGYDCRGVLSTGDKLIRSQAFNAACERGDVYLIDDAWNDEFIESLVEFPRGKHDDDVDAAVGAFNDLARGSAQWGEEDLQTVFTPAVASRKKSAQELLIEKLKGNR